MSRSNQTVQVTVRLSKDRYERVRLTAQEEHRPVEDVLDGLIVEGLESRTGTREMFERLSQDYRARLGREGRLSQSADAVRRELGALRERIASDLYSG